MVTEESLWHHRFETGVCGSLAEGQNEHRLRVLVEVGPSRRKVAPLWWINAEFWNQKNQETGNVHFQLAWKFCVVWDHNLSSTWVLWTFYPSPAGTYYRLTVSLSLSLFFFVSLSNMVLVEKCDRNITRKKNYSTVHLKQNKQNKK